MFQNISNYVTNVKSYIGNGSQSSSNRGQMKRNGSVELCEVAAHETVPTRDANALREDSTRLKRDLLPSHLNMLAFSGAIGTGLIFGTADSLRNSGPGPLLTSFCVMGVVVQGVMTGLGELATECPMQKGFAGYATRFVHPAIGFATGWNYYLKYVVLLPTNLTATAMVFQVWRPHINLGVWIAVFGAAIVLLNVFSVAWYGKAQLFLGYAKMAVMFTLVVGCFVVTAGGGPNDKQIGFAYWHRAPRSNGSVSSRGPAFLEMRNTGLTGNNARFAAVWYSMVQATFAYTGVEIVGASFGEVQEPKRNIPKAIMMTPIRIVLVYIVGVFALTMSVPSNSDALFLAVSSNRKTGSASPFVIALVSAGIRVLPDILNGCLLVFTLSAANADVYTASRTLHGLAKDGQAPKFLKRTNRWGVPIWPLIISSSFICLGFANCKSDSATVFQHLVAVTVILGALNWLNILMAYFGWYRARRAQNRPRSELLYRGWGQPYLGMLSFVITAVIILTASFQAWLPIYESSRAIKIITCTVGVVIYSANIIIWKRVHGGQMVDAKTADLSQQDEDDRVLPQHGSALRKREEERNSDNSSSRMQSHV